MKRKFLVVHDYQHGAACAFVYAKSITEVRKTFPDLEVFDADDPHIPPWILKQPETMLVTDIGDLDGWLKAHYERNLKS